MAGRAVQWGRRMGGTLSQPLRLEEKQAVHQPLAGQGHNIQHQSGCRAKAAQAEPQSQEGPPAEASPGRAARKTLSRNHSPLLLNSSRERGSRASWMKKETSKMLASERSRRCPGTSAGYGATAAS